MLEALVALFGCCLVASPFLTLRAIFSRSWILMWFAALGSFVVSIVGMFSIGAFVFLLTSMQLAAVLALRWSFSPPWWTVSVLSSVLIWVLLVPVQISGHRWLGGLGAYQIAGILGLMLTLFPWGSSEDRSRRGDNGISPAQQHGSPGATTG